MCIPNFDGNLEYFFLPLLVVGEINKTLTTIIFEHTHILFIICLTTFIAFLYYIFRDIFKYVPKNLMLSFGLLTLCSASLFYLFPILRQIIFYFFLLFPSIAYFESYLKLNIHTKLKKRLLDNIYKLKILSDLLLNFHFWVHFVISETKFTIFTYHNHVFSLLYIFFSCIYFQVVSYINTFGSLAFVSLLYVCFLAGFLKMLYFLSSALAWKTWMQHPDKMYPFIEQFWIPDPEDPKNQYNKDTYNNKYYINTFALRHKKYTNVGLAFAVFTLGVTFYYAHLTHQAAVAMQKTAEEAAKANQVALQANMLKEVQMGLRTEDDYRKHFPHEGKK